MFQFTTSPQEGKWGISGDKHFVLDSLGVREIPSWEVWKTWNPNRFMPTTACMINSCLVNLAMRVGVQVPSEKEVERYFLRMAAQSKQALDAIMSGPEAEGVSWFYYQYDYKGKDPAYQIASSAKVAPYLKNYLAQPSFYQRLVDQGVKVASYPAGSFPKDNGVVYSNADTYGFRLDPKFDPKKNY